jgi:twitching motility protein PilU
MFLTPVLKLMAEKQASDLFISAGTPMCIKIQGTIMPVNTDVMDGPTVRKVAYELMSVEDQQEFEKTWEMNFSVPIPEVGRFRVNVFKQRGNVAMVIRYLRTQTPGLGSAAPADDPQGSDQRETRRWCWWSAQPARASPPRSPR